MCLIDVIKFTCFNFEFHALLNSSFQRKNTVRPNEKNRCERSDVESVHVGRWLLLALVVLGSVVCAAAAQFRKSGRKRHGLCDSDISVL